MMTDDPIRPAVPADEPAIVACVQAAYEHYIARMGKPPAPMLADYGALIAQGVVYVLPGDAGLRGVLVAFPKDGTFFIENVAVDPRYQGQGLGTRLMTFAEELATAAGLTAITLYTNELMSENVRYYGKIGYMETARRTEDGYRRVYMRKALTSPRAGNDAT
jgi:ribosomal protein S18 acetylase RimI-like enzyme